MDAFKKDTRFQKELETYLKFAFGVEYRMLTSFYPDHKLLVD